MVESESRRIVNFTRADEVELQPVRWLIDGWLVEDTLAGMVGPSGSCKSFLALDWACRVATGAPWFGRNVKQGAVFYLAGEGRSGIRKRISGWERINGVPIAGAPLFLADNLPGLCDPMNAASVITEIDAIAERMFFESGCDPALIVLDTVARAMSGGDENSAKDMGQFVQSMDWLRERWGACVLSVHHTGHGTEAQDRARGSSAYRAALDSEFVVKATIDTVTVRGSKAKDWHPPVPLALAKHTVAIEIPGQRGPIADTTLALRDGAGMVVELDKREEVSRLHGMGMNLRDIASQTGVGKSTVQRWTRPKPCPID